jgi:hypothetical protein
MWGVQWKDGMERSRWASTCMGFTHKWSTGDWLTHRSLTRTWNGIESQISQASACLQCQSSGNQRDSQPCWLEKMQFSSSSHSLRSGLALKTSAGHWRYFSATARLSSAVPVASLAVLLPADPGPPILFQELSLTRLALHVWNHLAGWRNGLKSFFHRLLLSPCLIFSLEISEHVRLQKYTM